MSEHAARSAMMRMNLREVAVAAHYTGLVADLRMLAAANQEQAEQQFQNRRIELVAAYGLQPVEQRKPFAFSSGIAIIPVHGTLINRFGYSWGYVTGYNFIRQQTALAAADPDVLGIVYDHNSYGGEAAGCFECAADLSRLAAGKPTLAIIDSNCYSASYAMAAGADRIVCTPSGGAGSIGVVAMHVDMSKALEDWGITVTFIFAGDHKVDGNPYEALPAEVKADIQRSVNASYEQFVAHVAQGRSMDAKAVRDTQARIYKADEAQSLGLIDAVATPQDALRGFLGELSGSNLSLQSTKGDMMSDQTKPGANTQATPDQLAQTAASAATAERARIAGVQNCEEAKGRAKLAAHLALSTELSVDAAKAILAAAPTETQQAAAPNAFKAAMDASQHPNVGADSAGNGGTGEMSEAQQILANAKRAGVIGASRKAA